MNSLAAVAVAVVGAGLAAYSAMGMSGNWKKYLLPLLAGILLLAFGIYSM